MFMGEYSHTIDAKGRIIVPVKFRESLGDNFVVTKGLDNCLFVYTKEDWQKLTSREEYLFHLYYVSLHHLRRMLYS